VTGRCKKIEEETTSECKEGYYRNPETGRCKKVAAAKTLTPCAEGYERNPETNRCRKISTNDASQYSIEEVEKLDPSTTEQKQVFIGGIVLLVMAGISVIYIVFQYRQEISKLFRRFKRRR
jgi:hypothetical protein